MKLVICRLLIFLICPCLVPNTFYRWTQDQKRIPFSYHGWLREAEMVQIWFLQGRGILSEVKQEAETSLWEVE